MLKWTVFIDQSRQQPSTGDYSEWKEKVSEYCEHRCTYCCIHVSRYGGIDNFHVDHFRPKSRPEFEHLRKAIGNLYLACAICNRFKSNHWPNDPLPDHSIPAFPDPANCNYNEIFQIDGLQVKGLVVAARFVVEQLYLNRPQLLRERRLAVLRARAEGVIDRMKLLIRDVGASETANSDVLRRALACNQKMVDCQSALLAVYSSRPYELHEVRRRGTG